MLFTSGVKSMMNRNTGLLSESHSSSARAPASDVTVMMCRNVMLGVMDFSFLKSGEQGYYASSLVK